MDNLTHSAVGILLSRAGLRRVHPRAPLILLLAANTPDVDVISALGGAGVYFQYHRWLTHALLALPVMALLPPLVVRALYRKGEFGWLRAWLLSVCGVASHLALDYTNPYGIRLWLPFDASWPALDITSVVDVWIWLVLGIALLWPMLSRLVAAEMGAKGPVGRGWAIIGLLFLVLYNGGRAVLHQQAVDAQLAFTYNGEGARRAWAFPSHANPLVWKGVVETGSAWAVQEIRLGEELDSGDATILYKPENTAAIEAARRDPLVATFLGFARTPHWKVTPAPDVTGGTRVDVQDLRFGFTTTAIVDANREVVRTLFTF